MGRERHYQDSPLRRCVSGWRSFLKPCGVYGGRSGEGEGLGEKWVRKRQDRSGLLGKEGVLRLKGGGTGHWGSWEARSPRKDGSLRKGCIAWHGPGKKKAFTTTFSKQVLGEGGILEGLLAEVGCVIWFTAEDRHRRLKKEPEGRRTHLGSL